MKKTVLSLSAIALSCIALTPLAHAGTRFGNSDFLVDSTNHHAWGVVSGVRNTPDDKARIECGLEATPEQLSMFCWGQDSSEKYASCFGSSPALVQAAAAIQSDSTIEFRWNDRGDCTYLQVLVESAAPPKAP